MTSSHRNTSPGAHASFASSTSPLPQPAAPSFQPRYSTSPSAERRSFDRKSPNDIASRAPDGHAPQVPTILIRRLPSTMSHEALNSMLLFAEDCQSTNFIDIPDEQGYLSAIARFRTIEAAYEVRNRLHGKMNSTGDANMAVEVLSQNGAGTNGYSPADGPGLTRTLSNAASSRGSSTNGAGARHTSRYFQSMGEKVSPTNIASNAVDGDEAHSQPHKYFSPTSPRGSSFRDGMRVSGKSMINEDADDETRELLKDPVAYAMSNQGRRPDPNSQPPVSRLANLNLNTSAHHNTNGATPLSPTAGGFGSNRNMPHQPGSPTTEMSPTTLTNGMPLSPTSGNFPLSPTQMQQRHHYPPANPADQNPPCNTLYVGNLPVDTSEDELKNMFVQQRGYKRLCFRTKHNGPMCFVEFEDISFATKALNELYGKPLHNSVKGGIRLSFSKNPLGVRTGQASSMTPGSPLGSPGGAGGLGSVGVPPGFSTANGPPPGLAMPPGLGSPPTSAGTMVSGGSSNGGFNGFFNHGPQSPPLSHHQARAGAYVGAGGLGNIGSAYADGNMGR